MIQSSLNLEHKLRNIHTSFKPHPCMAHSSRNLVICWSTLCSLQGMNWLESHLSRQPLWPPILPGTSTNFCYSFPSNSAHLSLFLENNIVFSRHCKGSDSHLGCSLCQKVFLSLSHSVCMFGKRFLINLFRFKFGSP